MHTIDLGLCDGDDEDDDCSALGFRNSYLLLLELVNSLPQCRNDSFDCVAQSLIHDYTNLRSPIVGLHNFGWANDLVRYSLKSHQLWVYWFSSQYYLLPLKCSTPRPKCLNR